MILSSLLVLAAAYDVRAQVSTASIVPIGMNEHGVQGQVVGTGADGTTFVLSATLDALDVPYTMTLVQDISHISKGGLVVTSLITIPYNVQCDLQANGEAVCIEFFSPGTLTQTQDVHLQGVPVSTGTLTGASPGSTFSTNGQTTPIATKTRILTMTAPSGGDLPTDDGGGIFPSSGDDGDISPPREGGDGLVPTDSADTVKAGLTTVGFGLLITGLAALLTNL